MPPSYLLTTQPWIPVHDLDNTTFRHVGLTEALVRAHRLVLPGHAQEGPVLLRILAAAYDAAAGPTTYEEWTAAWQATTLDTARITTYLHQWEHRLDLLHPDHPAFQCGALTQYPRGAQVLHPAYLGGDGGEWSNHVLQAEEGDFPAWQTAEAARNLLILTAYDVAGIKRAAPGDPAERRGKIYGAQPGHIAQLTHTNVRGHTLKDTLLLNLPPQPRRTGDAPVWERPTPEAPMISREPTGRLDVLTWPARRIHLHADHDGKIDRVAWHDGDRMTDSWQQLAADDPMSMWRTAKNDRWAPYTPTDHRGLIVPWKVAQAVLDPAGDEGGQPVHCGASQHLAHLLNHRLLADYEHLMVEASCVQHTNQHATVISHIHRQPVALATGQYLTNPDQRADLAAAARTATAYLHHIQLIVKQIAPPHTNLHSRDNFMTLYGRWPEVAALLSRNPVQGRTLWRSMLHEQAQNLIQSLPLKPADKARAAAEVKKALTTTRFLGQTSPAAQQQKKATTNTARAGRPTSRNLTAFDTTKTLAQWAKDPRCQVSYPTLRRRAETLAEGEDAEHIITAPADRGPRTKAPEPRE